MRAKDSSFCQCVLYGDIRVVRPIECVKLKHDAVDCDQTSSYLLNCATLDTEVTTVWRYTNLFIIIIKPDLFIH